MGTPKATGAGDSTYLDTEKRVNRAEELLASQHTGKQIVRTLCQEFGVVERTSYRYVQLAYGRIQADAADDRAIRKARARMSWQRQYRRCLDREDMSAANYALERLCKLDGLFAPERVEISATLSVQMQIRNVVGVLDIEGLAALEVLQRQIDAARARGLLTDGGPGDEDDVIDIDEPRPIPAKGRGRKSARPTSETP